MLQDAVQFLTNKYSDMTESEKQLTDVIISHLDEFIHMSVKQLAALAGVSVATVVRLSQHLGYDGFTAFKLNMAKMQSARKDHVLDIENRDNNITSQIRKVLNSDLEAFKLTVEYLDLALIEKAAKKIVKAKNLLFFGSATSNVVCTDAVLKYQRLGMTAYNTSDLHSAAMYMSHFSHNDVIVAVSHSGQTREAINALRIAKENKISTIAITTFPNSPLCEYADLAINTVTRESPIHKIAITSRISQFAVIDALFTATLMSNYDSFIKSITAASDMMKHI